MFGDMFLKTIPRSLRAAVALVVALICLGGAANRFPAIFLGLDPSPMSIVILVLSIVVGIPAMITFYYFQGLDGNTDTKRPQDLEVLHRAHLDNEKRERLSQGATPAFPELHTSSVEEHRRNIKSS